MIEVRRVKAKDLREVRFKVLWQYLNSASEANIDIDESEGAIHLAGVINGEIVGCASLFIQDCDRYPEIFKGTKVYRLRAMGVLESVQGMGIGAAIINHAENLCSKNEAQTIWCDAREIAWGFYSKLGFIYASCDDGYECDAYEVRNVGLHKMMYKHI
ncbi:MAG: hypothetical protein CL847_02235 [Crocinitomicaceae bacterium]|nr:hypothetical protein [Crocinitomicaceae bacterium]|tara:strand:- start:6679 stop:7152 length:474 start_codon:yes stop_codon:yes gene_type:complete